MHKTNWCKSMAYLGMSTAFGKSSHFFNMAQYDVYKNPSSAQREAYPYMVDIQNDMFGSYVTRLTMPLQRFKAKPASLPHRLRTPLVIHGEALYLAPHLCAAFPVRALGKTVARVADQQAVIVDAFDAVVSGV
ncbi:MAG: CcdB family protein [Cytophagales bacterium]|nr:CcdB family protein [Cytophagales bacterium]